MANPFVGEIRLFGGNFAPAGWMFCDGSLLAIAQNDVLFSLIGTTYGGDGVNTFALPDLRGRVPVHRGAGPGLTPVVQGQQGGNESVALTPSQMPSHTHVLRAASGAASSGAVANTVLAATSVNSYGSGPPSVAMAAAAVPAVGGSQPHDNMAPFCALSYIISLFGIYPSQN